ncbi:MAG: Sulfide dehydrogenase subunit beta precursor [Methanosaeta sp. PtaB.Bin039]|nr:MAG: Sulfide dehydrogenase subunit beta precursor [Methanosaeta sp. PtaB.Bin039]OPY47846.1 MAG: Sulfide dehydrogenase subunit beta precursor [Methanosaeta sp. PtaU1.Bin028]
MYEILKKETLAPNLLHMRFMAPGVARVARPGQFIIIRVDEKGERIPMGLAGWDAQEGWVDIVFYCLGTSTMKLGTMEVGEKVLNVAGPLGLPTEIENFGRVICACGCFGIGPSLPLIKALKEKGNEVITVVEGRGEGFVFWEDELKRYSDEVVVSMGDRSCGSKGWANDYITEQLKQGGKIDLVIVHGCPVMMRSVSEATRPYGVRTLVSLTPIMVDGTGMCGACRVEIGDKTRFACVEGPDFEGHSVNWGGMTLRLRQLLSEEDWSMNLWERENWHKLLDRPRRPGAKTIARPAPIEPEHSGGCCSL